MSTKTPNDGSLQSTKQMLDELDALMERMLSLPVNDLESAPPFPAEVVKAPPTLAAKLTILDAPAPRPAMALPHPVTNPPHITLPADRPQPQEPAASHAEPEPLSNEVVPPSVRPKLEPLLADIPDSHPPARTQWGYHPFLFINQGFDRSTTLLGGPGEWLRGQVGRNVLGLIGIALTLAAALWLVKDWLGWN